MELDWRERIRLDANILHGKPRINGTRIPVTMILGYLAHGRTVEQIIESFPDLKPDDITACLYYAKDLADFHSVGSSA